MPYVQIPRDLTKVKEKFLFGLPKRQVIYFAIGIVFGAVFFLLFQAYDLTMAVASLVICIMPFGFIGMYEKNGMTFDKMVVAFIRANLIRPKLRLYRSENIYEAIQDQIILDKEVKKIGYKKSLKSRLFEAIENADTKAPKTKRK